MVGSYGRYDFNPARQYAFKWTPNGWEELWEGVAYDVTYFQARNEEMPVPVPEQSGRGDA